MNFLYFGLLLMVWGSVITLFDFKGLLTKNPLVLSGQIVLNLPKNGRSFIEYLIKGKFHGTEVPRYKFYSQIIETLLELRKRFGCEVEEALLEVRKSVRRDIKEEEKIREVIMGTVFQYLMMASLTWGFSWYIHLSLNMKFQISAYIFVLAFQLLGGLTLAATVLILKNYYFNPFSQYLFAAYSFRSFLKVSMPLSGLQRKIDLDSLSDRKRFRFLKSRFEIILNVLKNSGTVTPSEMDLFIQEIWDLLEVETAKYQKKLVLIKMLLMMFFILPCFLYSLYSTIGKLHVL